MSTSTSNILTENCKLSLGNTTSSPIITASGHRSEVWVLPEGTLEVLSAPQARRSRSLL